MIQSHWLPPGYGSIEDAVKEMGLTIFGKNWDPGAPADSSVDPRRNGNYKKQFIYAQERLRDRFSQGKVSAFILDPDQGATKLEPHFWYDDVRIAAIFRYGYLVRDRGIPTDDYRPADDMTNHRSVTVCKVAVLVLDPETSSAARAEKLAEHWLAEALSSRMFSRKSEYLQSAQAQFAGLSKRSFSKAWDRVTQRSEHRWIRKPGPKSAQLIGSPNRS